MAVATLLAVPSVGSVHPSATVAPAPPTPAGLLRAAVASLEHGARPAAGRSLNCQTDGRSAARCGGAFGPAAIGNVTYPWANVTNNVSAPSPRTYVSMAYDPSAGDVLLFGGLSASGSALNDTWTFQAGRWTQRTPVVAPPTRRGAGLAYDSTDGYMVLFGGYSVAYGRGLNDTWAYSAGNWTNLSAAAPNASNTPPFRWFAGLADDPLDGYLLMFGGCNVIGCYGQLGDTWEFKAGNWTNLTSTTRGSPPPRNSPVMGWDPAADRVLLYGGSGPGAATTTVRWEQFNDTWEYGNRTWTELNTSVNPGHGSDGYLAYDAAGRYEVLFGGLADTPVGTANGASNETWIFLNGTWRNETANISVAPPGRSGIENAGAYDATGGYGVLFGGSNAAGTDLNDTWEFSWPLGASISAGRSSLDANQSDAIVVSGVGGSFVYSYGYQGLPTGCASRNVSLFGCRFPTPGHYEVNASVNDTAGNSVEVSVTITVATDPTLRAVVAPTIVDLGSNVTYTLAASGGMTPFSYSYSLLPRGCTGYDASVLVCRPSAAGVYTSSAQVVDAAGFKVTVDDLNLTVNVGPSVEVRSPRTSGVAPLLVALNATVHNGTAPYSYAWSFGDGSPNASGASVSHTFTKVGGYTVTVVATDAVGHTSSATVPIGVFAPLSVQAAASPHRGVAPLSVTLSATASGGGPGTTFNWTFGDGTPGGSGNDLPHIYYVPGEYNATVNVSDSEGDWATEVVAIDAIAPLAAPAVASRDLGEAPMVVSFQVSPVGGLAPFTYQWSFGDGTSANLSAPVHVYQSAGMYLAELEVNDALGEAVHSSVHLDIAPALQLNLSPLLGSIAVGTPLELNASVLGGYGVDSFVWTGLPRGCVGTNTSTLSCVPSAAGNYSISVNVTDSLGYSAIASTVLTVVPAVAASAGAPGSSTVVWIGIALAATAVAAIAIVALVRRRRSPPSAEVEEAEPFAEEPASDPATE